MKKKQPVPQPALDGTTPLANGNALLPYLVYPSPVKTITVTPDKDYNGAHHYLMANSKGFKNGEVEYTQNMTEIQFVKKNEDGTMVEGIQDEQLVYILLDRTRKLNARFPSEHNEQKIHGLEMFLGACKARIMDRMNRGVMGEHQK